MSASNFESSGMRLEGAPSSTSDLIGETLRRAILDGSLELGQPLVERKIAQELDVSKTPVREALIDLTRRGLVEFVRNRGARVRRLSKEDVIFVYETRLLLEPAAVSDGIRRAGAKFAERLAHAGRALDQAARCSEQGDSAGRSRHNRDFHQTLFAATPNYFVVETLVRLQDIAALGATQILWEHSESWVEESEEHQALLSAARDGDADMAESTLRDHIARALERIRAASGE